MVSVGKRCGERNVKMNEKKKYSQLDFEETNILDSDVNMNRFANTTSPSAEIAMSMNTNSHKLQLMKASLFIDEEYDNKSGKLLN